MPRVKEKPIVTLDQARERIQKLEALARKVLARLARIDPETVNGAWQKASEEFDRVRKASSLMVLKLAVATEVPRYLRNRRISADAYIANLLDVMDMSDDWWRRRGKLTTEEWAELILSFDFRAAVSESDPESAQTDDLPRSECA